MSNLEERKFLHDIASPISGALALIEGLLETLKVGNPLSSDDLDDLQLLFTVLGKAKESIVKRRNSIIQESD